ncbi:helix-turn-helix transcriptional regulator [Vibrio sp. RE86]|uniref:helix-turn-helix transcriptional regulator n=1 Tax=Vibrio sp. RE86 TaxID=2607605 RepID=UPI0014936DA4|nr:helix-turn-helix transcriptional regulator [Vibrio sp. RE86]NOH78766.1 helix-turn-helix transcriptional regulator [Vibrio sp. RE86]
MITWKQSLPGYEWLVHQIWYLEVEKDEEIESLPKLIPNPRAHIILSPSAQAYRYYGDNGDYSGLGCHLLTASEQILTLEDSAPLKRIGITLRPEALYLLHKNSSDKANHIGWDTWLDTLFPAQQKDELIEQSDRQAIINRIQGLVNNIKLPTVGDRAYQSTHQAIGILESGSSDCDIETLAELCACSRRTLERNFRLVTGLTIKKFQMMMNLENIVLDLYQHNKPIDWAEFSQRYGFSDQSHLIRQLKQQLKKTPASYLKQRDLTIDIYGDFE